MNELFANVHHGFSGGHFHTFGWGLGLFSIFGLLFLISSLAILALKGYSLWNAVKRDEKGWFVALLLINSLGILELIYLYFVVGKGRKAKHGEHHHNHAHHTHTTTPQ